MATGMQLDQQPSSRSIAPGEDLGPARLEVLAMAKKTASVVANEPNSLFRLPAVEPTVREALDAGAKFQFVFYKGSAASETEVLATLTSDHSPLLRLQEEFPDTCELFWMPKRLEREYIVVDDCCTLLENEHERREARPGAELALNNPRFAAPWATDFPIRRSAARRIEAYAVGGPKAILLGLLAAWRLLEEAFKHPLNSSTIVIDRARGSVTVGEEDPKQATPATV